MALTREKYKRVPDLYITGKELVLMDGSVMWLQALNPLERDEAQHDAQVARARLIMALRSDHASDERLKVEAAFWADGRTDAIQRLVNIKVNENLLEVVNAIRNDPDWKERLEILDRNGGLMGRPAEESEVALLQQVNEDYVAEVEKRQEDERAYLTSHYQAVPDAELIDEYVELYVERRGGEVARTEYELTEIWFAARACEGTQAVSGEWDHSQCESHQLRIYETKVEVHSLPDGMQDAMKQVMTDINMSVRDAKNSDRQGSSSGSSPLPSEVGESTPSTPTEIHAEPLGTSSQLSATP